MILEEETFKAFGYYASKLTHGSHTPVLAACNRCGKVRETTKNSYCSLCGSCAQKGNKNCLGRTWTEKQKVIMRGNTYALGYKHTEEANASMKGNTRGLGYKYSEEQKVRISGENHHNYGKRGEEMLCFKGGRKVVSKRHKAKRKRQLGYTLVMPLVEGEVGHHFTDEDVIGIPVEVH